MRKVAYVKIIRWITPDCREADLAARLKRFQAIVKANKRVQMPGKNQDYQAGYDIGAYVANEGEDYDFKDLDQLGNELLEELNYAELPVNNAEAFKEGLANGYVFSELGDEEE